MQERVHIGLDERYLDLFLLFIQLIIVNALSLSFLIRRASHCSNVLRVAPEVSWVR